MKKTIAVLVVIVAGLAFSQSSDINGFRSFVLGTAPSSPASGKVTLYGDVADGILKCKNSSGTSCFAAATGLPTQTSHANELLTTDGTTASWTKQFIYQTERLIGCNNTTPSYLLFGVYIPGCAAQVLATAGSGGQLSNQGNIELDFGRNDMFFEVVEMLPDGWVSASTVRVTLRGALNAASASNLFGRAKCVVADSWASHDGARVQHTFTTTAVASFDYDLDTTGCAAKGPIAMQFYRDTTDSSTANIYVTGPLLIRYQTTNQ